MRHVTRRAGLVPAAIAGRAPVLPVVRAWCVVDVVGRRVSAGDDSGLLSVYGERRSGDRDLGLAVADRDAGRIPGRVHVDAIGAGAKQGDGAGGRVDLEAVVLAQAAKPHVERSLRNPYLRRVVVERQDAK